MGVLETPLKCSSFKMFLQFWENQAEPNCAGVTLVSFKCTLCSIYRLCRHEPLLM